MNDAGQPVLRDIVLVGGGHSHVGVLRDFAMRPLPGVRITLVCTDAHTPYSGMLPGYVAGHYGYDDVHIDLSRLAVFAGARFIRAEVTGIDRAATAGCCCATVRRCPTTWCRSTSAPRRRSTRCPVRRRMRSRSSRSTSSTSAGWRCSSACAQHAGRDDDCRGRRRRRWRRADAGDAVPPAPGAARRSGAIRQQLVFHLFTADATILPTHNRAVQRRFDDGAARSAACRCIERRRGAAGARRSGCRPRTGAGSTADEIVWVTQAGGAAWLAETGLALDKRGFIRVNDCLQSVTDPRVFAAGDVASMEHRALEKAGVFAVRMAAPLARNLRRGTGRPAAAGLPAAAPLAGADQHRRPVCGGVARRVVVCRRLGLALEGLDRPPLHAPLRTSSRRWTTSRRSRRRRAAPGADGARSRCRRCRRWRCVVAAVVPRSVPACCRARWPAWCRCRDDDVLIGLHAPDDAAIVRVPPGKAMVHTVDFFRAFIDDPYVFGQIAANHALGDIFAMGAQAQSATAIATVPPGLDDKVEDTAAADDDRRGRGAQCGRLRAGRRPYRRGQRTGAGFCGQRPGRCIAARRACARAACGRAMC